MKKTKTIYGIALAKGFNFQQRPAETLNIVKKTLITICVIALPLLKAWGQTTNDATSGTFITMVASAPSYVGGTNSSTVNIGAYQTAEVVSYPYEVNYRKTYLQVTTQGQTFTFSRNEQGEYGMEDLPEPFIVVGPATLQLCPIMPAQDSYSGSVGFCTIRIKPESFPPDKTLILLPGTNSANVVMESSTDLANWSTATNGTYGGTNVAMFFRIRLCPLPGMVPSP